MMKLVLLLVFSGMTCSEGDEGPQPADSACEMYTDMKELAVSEGEALHIMPDGLHGSTWDHDQHNLFSWRRGQAHFSSSEAERIHHHGPTLLFLPLSVNDSGLYIARLNYSGKCHIFHVPVFVQLASVPLGKHRLYTPIRASDSNPTIPCPEQVADLCKDLKGVLSWYRNFSLLAGEELPGLQLQRATKADDAVYTCKCVWRHNQKDYYSTASRQLQMREKTTFQDIRIVRPTTTELPVQPGSPLEIECVAFFGTNMTSGYEVWWEKNNLSVTGMEGYNQTFSRTGEYFSSTLTIHKVLTSDLHASFRCRASNGVETRSHALSLKPAESWTYLVVALVCVAIVLAAVVIKYFTVDLVLFSRRFLRCTRARNDGLQYDVYVVYHPQEESKAILNQFLSQALPLVLERKCDYRVFIHGRDDTPGEDRLEQVEERVRLSRRLMVVRPPGSGVNKALSSAPSSPAGLDIDWLVGLHQETRVILVQLGEVGPRGHTHVSAALQHLVHKRVPLYWQEDSPGAAHWNSRFWKRVRYAMPTPPPASHPSSSVV
ncbi:hypothetical protein NHX12_006833 [Muraenolepis orangiensis]|uniref:Uncharacterized protein n=1 Tax=Muraenolepis orangiensis TaxID=630683 RepID=A0A9Q0ICF9_9TELE|nr:hypothetical protein NHX12_006833 [Muraenolepis orangiensis]